MFGFIKKYFLSPFNLVFKDWKAELGNFLLVIIPILLAFPIIHEFIISELQWIILLVFIVAASWIYSNYQKKSKSDLILEKGQLDMKIDSLNNSLDTQTEFLESVPFMITKYIFHHLGLDYNDRITIYRYNKDKFIPVGRFSLNKEFSFLGRKEYPKDKGYISKSWGKGELYVDGLPSYENHPKQYLEKVSKESNMEKGVIKTLSMKSRSYYCLNLEYNQEPVAVVVVESLEPSFKEFDLMEETLKGEFGKLLSESINNNLPIGKEGE
ncbi:hypothetical protein [Oceanobacillus kimchii]|uniref:hypothetical protein n=1 Tax=Oceanobacillus kimchii TaxID=746691 RepID=UPI003C78C379